MIAELFENIVSIISMFPPVVVIPAVLVLLINRKSRNKSKLKKRFLFGFFIFIALSVLSEVVLYTDAINIIENIADVLGEFFFVLFYYAVQTFCFISGITLLISYIILSVREKKNGVNIIERYYYSNC